jgi:hypothetical protein
VHLRRPNGGTEREHRNGAAHEAPAPTPAPAPQTSAPPVVAPRTQTFTDIPPGTVTAAFTVADGGGYFSFDYHTASPGSLLLEAYATGVTAQDWVGLRVLNTFVLEGNVGATLTAAQYRFNNLGPAVATVTMTGPT